MLKRLKHMIYMHHTKQCRHCCYWCKYYEECKNNKNPECDHEWKIIKIEKAYYEYNFHPVYKVMCECINCGKIEHKKIK